jgi:hypothetical protein
MDLAQAAHESTNLSSNFWTQILPVQLLDEGEGSSRSRSRTSYSLDYRWSALIPNPKTSGGRSPHSSPRCQVEDTCCWRKTVSSRPEEEEDGPSRLGATVAAAVNCWSLGAAVAI